MRACCMVYHWASAALLCQLYLGIIYSVDKEHLFLTNSTFAASVFQNAE